MCPGGDQRIPGVIVHQSEPVTYYYIDVGEGGVWKRHQDDVKLQDLPDPEPDVSSPEAENDLDATNPSSLSDNGATEPSAVIVPVPPSTERNSTPDKVQVVNTLLGKDISFILINI